VQGDHYQVGFQIGETFKDRFVKYFSVDSTINQVLIPFYNTPQGKRLFNQFVKINQEAYPNYFDEMRGYADGSGVPLYKIWLMNLENELADLAPSNLTKRRKIDMSFFEHCSDLHILNSQNALLGHNEDNDPDIKPFGYFVEYHIQQNSSSEVQFFRAFHYPGHLPGNTFGWNKNLVFSTNDVEPVPVLVGRARAFLGRDMCTSKTVEEALGHINVPNRAFGFSLNVGSIKEKKTWNIELAPHGYAFTEVVSNFTHFNMYKMLNIPQLYDPSTAHRQVRANQIATPMNYSDMINLLGDNHDKQYPIYRNGAGPDVGVATIATIVYDLIEMSVVIWDKNPRFSDPIYSFDL